MPGPAHFRAPPSLLNIPKEPFRGPGASLYGPRGPQMAALDYRARKALSGPPESLEHHIQDAIARVPDLSPRQRLALRNTMMTMTRDIGFSWSWTLPEVRGRRPPCGRTSRARPSSLYRC